MSVVQNHRDCDMETFFIWCHQKHCKISWELVWKSYLKVFDSSFFLLITVAILSYNALMHDNKAQCLASHGTRGFMLMEAASQP